MTYVRSTIQQRYDMVHERALELQIEGACTAVVNTSHVEEPNRYASWHAELAAYAARAMSVATLCRARAWQSEGMGHDAMASAWRERAHRYAMMAVYAYGIMWRVV